VVAPLGKPGEGKNVVGIDVLGDLKGDSSNFTPLNLQKRAGKKTNVSSKKHGGDMKRQKNSSGVEEKKKEKNGKMS